MDWKDIKDDVAAAAPILGTLVGGPAGGAIGSIIASVLGASNDPSAVQQALKTNPDAAVKLRQIEADQATKLRELAVTAENNRLAAESAAVAAVNMTMQTESKSDHWPTYAWRPAIGFAFAFNLWAGALNITAAYFAVMFMGVKPDILALLPQMLTAQAALNGTALPILGIAAYFRGKMQADPSVPTDNRG